jgi:hypothetical protein
MANTLAYYADYDDEFALFVEECRLTQRHTQCSVTHAVVADEMQCIANLERAASMDPQAVDTHDAYNHHERAAMTFHRWSVAHALYGVLLAREGL